MSDGITAEISELIALQQYAKAARYRPEQRALRAGDHLSKRRGRGMDFAEVRHYQAGDEIRHMEWRITARMGKPHIKIYQEERERPVVLVTDFSPSMYFGSRLAFKSVIAARLTAMLAWTAARQGDAVGGLLFSKVKHQELSPQTREEGVLILLKALSDYTKLQQPCVTADTSSSFIDALKRLNRVARPGSILVIISDFYQLQPECIDLLVRLCKHSDVLAYHVCDPLELAPPKPDRYALTNGKDALLLDTSQSNVLDAYAQYCEQRMAAIQTQLQRLRIQYVKVTPMTDIPRLVFDTFPRSVFHG